VLWQACIVVVERFRKTADAVVDRAKKVFISKAIQRLTGSQYAESAFDRIVVIIHVADFLVDRLEPTWSLSCLEYLAQATSTGLQSIEIKYFVSAETLFVNQSQATITVKKGMLDDRLSTYAILGSSAMSHLHRLAIVSRQVAHARMWPIVYTD